MTDTAQGSPAVRRFVVAAVPGALVSWSVGFELGAGRENGLTGAPLPAFTE